MVVDRRNVVGRRRYRNDLDVESSSTMAVVVIVIIRSGLLLLGCLAALLMIRVSLCSWAGDGGCANAKGQYDTGERQPEA